MREGAVNRVIVREIEPPMQRRNALMRQILKQDVLKQVHVKMDDVKLIDELASPDRASQHARRGGS